MSLDATFTPQNHCPKCGYRTDAASVARGQHHRPNAGDISVCMNCGAITIFNDDLTLREPTGKELLEASLNPDVIQAQIVRDGMNFPNLAERQKKRDTE